MVGDFQNETNFLNKLLLTATQISRICNAFVNGSSGHIKFLKTQLSKMVQLRVFFTPDALGLISSFPPVKLINSIVNSLRKE